MDTQMDRDAVRLTASDELYRGFYRFQRLHLNHRLYRGGWTDTVRREVLIQPEATGVLLYDPAKDCVALVEQFRVGAYCRESEPRPWLLEIVAGLIEPGETPEGVAHREALEESGCTLRALEAIARYYSSPGGTNEFLHLYCGWAELGEAGGIHGLATENEDIRLHVLDSNDAFAAVTDGHIANGNTVMALFWLQLNRDRLRQQWC